MAAWFCVLVTGADGTQSVVGPFRSERLAAHQARRLMRDENPPDSAEVHLMGARE